MKTKPATTDHDATLAKPLAPEDVRPGDYVAVLDEEYQYPAIVWYCEPPMGREQEVIRVRIRPNETSGPLRVIDACLPFVFVKPPKGPGHTLDVRSVRLARLDRNYARRVSRSLVDKKSKRKKK